METAPYTWLSPTFKNAVDSAARPVLTGQVQSQNMRARRIFVPRICNGLSMLGCNSNLQIDMESYASFSGASYASPLNADGTLNTSLNNFQPGAAGQVVLLRAMYTWPVATPLLTPFLTNMANNNHLVTATATFRNEPY